MRQFQKKPDCEFITETVIESQENMVLSDQVINLVSLLQKEQACTSLLLQHKLPITNKIMMHGKPGNGKTMFASCLAKHLRYRLFNVSLSSLVDCKMGQTPKNMDSLLNYISQIDCNAVIFMDEVDSIAGERNGGDALEKEYHRALNSFLTAFAKIPPNVILMCATNLIEQVDRAFLRRFDRVIEFFGPDKAEKTCFVDQLQKEHRLKMTPEDRAIVLQEQSYSNIKRMFINIAKERILNSTLF